MRLRNGRPIPTLDDQSQQQIVAAFQSVCDGHSADFLLCDRQLNSQFVRACKQSGVAGNAYVWNRLLLRIRKSGLLPASAGKRERLKQSAMDRYMAGAEVAMHLLQLDYGMKLDDVLCSPDVAAEFDQRAAMFAPGFSSFEYRWAALTIRKRATTSKKLAKTQYATWLRRKLPDPVPLAQCTRLWFERGGVYLLAGENQTLYVGETSNVALRVEQILNSQSWTDLSPTAMIVVETDDRGSRHGLQSALIRRVRPLLNSQLLMPRMERPGSP